MIVFRGNGVCIPKAGNGGDISPGSSKVRDLADTASWRSSTWGARWRRCDSSSFSIADLEIVALAKHAHRCRPARSLPQSGCVRSGVCQVNQNPIADCSPNAADADSSWDIASLIFGVVLLRDKGETCTGLRVRGVSNRMTMYILVLRTYDYNTQDISLPVSIVQNPECQTLAQGCYDSRENLRETYSHETADSNESALQAGCGCGFDDARCVSTGESCMYAQSALRTDTRHICWGK